MFTYMYKLTNSPTTKLHTHTHTHTRARAHTRTHTHTHTHIYIYISIYNVVYKLFSLFFLILSSKFLITFTEAVDVRQESNRWGVGRQVGGGGCNAFGKNRERHFPVSPPFLTRCHVGWGLLNFNEPKSFSGFFWPSAVISFTIILGSLVA